MAPEVGVTRPVPTDSEQERPVSPERLDSWKDIATYLKRSVRTVRRWEAEEGLPSIVTVIRVPAACVQHRNRRRVLCRRSRSRLRCGHPRNLQADISRTSTGSFRPDTASRRLVHRVSDDSRPVANPAGNRCPDERRLGRRQPEPVPENRSGIKSMNRRQTNSSFELLSASAEENYEASGTASRFVSGRSLNSLTSRLVRADGPLLSQFHLWAQWRRRTSCRKPRRPP